MQNPSVQALAFEDLSIGQRAVLLRSVRESDVNAFAAVSGDHNPVHVSNAFAQTTRFGQRIAHGMFTGSLVSALIGTRLPGSGAIYLSQSFFFRAPVKIGDVIEVSVEVAELIAQKNRARLICECRVDLNVVLDGEAWVRVPSRAEMGGGP